MRSNGKKEKKNLQQKNDRLKGKFPVSGAKQSGIASEMTPNNQVLTEQQMPTAPVSPAKCKKEPSSGQETSGLNASFLSTMSKQVTELVNTGEKIRNDLKNLTDYIDSKSGGIDTKVNTVDVKINSLLRKNDFELTAGSMSNGIQNALRTLEAKIQNVGQYLQFSSNKTSQEILSVSSEVKKSSNAQKNAKNELSQQLNAVEDKLKGIGESTDLIQSLPGKIDGIAELLSAKGLRIKQALPAINRDEETLAQLAQYGEEIFHQLATAARWYARVLPELSKHEETIGNLNAAHQKENEIFSKNGEERGRKAIIKNLLSLYDEENLHELMEPAEEVDGRLKVLATFLKNQGVEPIYQMHDEIEITEDNLINYEHNIANLRPGKIVIISPGYTFDTQTVSKAKYIPAEDYYVAQQTESPETIPSEEIASCEIGSETNEEPVNEPIANELSEVTNAVTTNNENPAEESFRKE